MADVLISFGCILQFLIDVVRELLFDKINMIKLIKKCTKSSKMLEDVLLATDAEMGFCVLFALSEFWYGF